MKTESCSELSRLRSGRRNSHKEDSGADLEIQPSGCSRGGGNTKWSVFYLLLQLTLYLIVYLLTQRILKLKETKASKVLKRQLFLKGPLCIIWRPGGLLTSVDVK
jgi:hypothetical protein